ncbi:hypothetical protein [Streptomyces sp. MK5]|uniref:hypothetical protein n=1 Tax=Streptomyces sp. MK5 TaxID=3064253 RepID=UPI0027407E44|nr:hypothetical protein [Streptomyces sp. MK5]
MPRGRHRHSPPLHRLLPPSAIAGVSLVCALGPWVFTAPVVLRSLAAAAALTALTGAVVMRRWDAQAGRTVADLTRARASDEWRFEERVAELESDLEESRELRVRLEHKLRAKRKELAGLRNEHAALLRRYATAETERASALEGRRLLELEAAPDARALPAALADRAAATTGTEAVDAEAVDAEAVDAEAAGATEAVATDGVAEESVAATPGVFSPEGSELFLRAKAALSRFAGDAEPAKEAAVAGAAAGTATDGDADAAPEDEPQGQPVAADAHERAAATPTTEAGEREPGGSAGRTEAETGTATATAPAPEATTAVTADAETTIATPEPPARGRPAEQQPTGHFTVPTAVAVVPAAPARRPVVEGGFDFFGTKNTKKGSPSTALEAVQNEDLADVVGQEALALHKAESESQYKRAGADAHGVGQVIDLTAHDETEQIDLQGLRTAAS